MSTKVKNFCDGLSLDIKKEILFLETINKNDDG